MTIAKHIAATLFMFWSYRPSFAILAAFGTRLGASRMQTNHMIMITDRNVDLQERRFMSICNLQIVDIYQNIRPRQHTGDIDDDAI